MHLNYTQAQTILDGYGMQGKFVHVNGNKTFVTENGNGPILLLIHGLDSSVYTWRFNFNILSAKFHVIAPDLPGFGFSELTNRNGCYIQYYIDFIHELLKDYTSNGIYVIGHSFGGTIGTEFCRQYEHLVRKLVLVSAPTVDNTIIPKKKLENLLMFSYQNKNFVTDEFVKFLKLSESQISAKNVIDSIETESDIFFDNHFNPLKVPCKIIWGQDDALFPAETALRTKAMFNNAEVSILPDCGHAPHEELSAEFDLLSIRFLQN
ncbi:alpha/beta fold hydrolase [Thermodesulfobacteriota bacterium]